MAFGQRGEGLNIGASVKLGGVTHNASDKILGVEITQGRVQGDIAPLRAVCGGGN